jgi:hypothetical protein
MEVISRKWYPLKTWHRIPRELPEETPSRWRWLSERLLRRLEEKVTIRCQNPL